MEATSVQFDAVEVLACGAVYHILSNMQGGPILSDLHWQLLRFYQVILQSATVLEDRNIKDQWLLLLRKLAQN